ncbi:hypothetical protein ACRALDRAFT_1091572 [Sodiomyces alcalophilus JCM 7366]|uniref:uncharacterized protein n=1 Tax=Sodiomyces alcalophilus JCM 7366 TaxID=591952 RepID=UPI0039B6837D
MGRRYVLRVVGPPTITPVLAGLGDVSFRNPVPVVEDDSTQQMQHQRAACSLHPAACSSQLAAGVFSTGFSRSPQGRPCPHDVSQSFISLHGSLSFLETYFAIRPSRAGAGILAMVTQKFPKFHSLRAALRPDIISFFSLKKKKNFSCNLSLPSLYCVVHLSTYCTVPLITSFNTPCRFSRSCFCSCLFSVYYHPHRRSPQSTSHPPFFVTISITTSPSPRRRPYLPTTQTSATPSKLHQISLLDFILQPHLTKGASEIWNRPDPISTGQSKVVCCQHNCHSSNLMPRHIFKAFTTTNNRPIHHRFLPWPLIDCLRHPIRLPAKQPNISRRDLECLGSSLPAPIYSTHMTTIPYRAQHSKAQGISSSANMGRGAYDTTAFISCAIEVLGTLRSIGPAELRTSRSTSFLRKNKPNTPWLQHTTIPFRAQRPYIPHLLLNHPLAAAWLYNFLSCDDSDSISYNIPPHDF